MTSRRKKKRVSLVARKNDCVLFCIDPAATSGAALLLGGEVTWHASITTALQRKEAIATALLLAETSGKSLVVVAEKWTAGGWRSAAQMLGMGAQWGRWEEALDLAGVPKRRRVRVFTQTWRSKVLKGARTKLAAESYVKARWGVEAGDDVADAACIGAWAEHAGEVAAVLPKHR